ncbi:MAG: hypothetical protein HZB13_03965 [Acidobacteria bacterium]|nr:hypothetical protein [Acidobacteriota bacterium]
MDPTAVSFASAAASLVSKGERDPVDALCALSAVQRAFEVEMLGLEQRAAGLDPAVLPPDASLPAGEPEPDGAFVLDSRRMPMVWLLLAGFSAMAFAAGFWFGRHAG